VDGSGNVFVTGSSATIAYSSAGVPLWTNRSGGGLLAVDGSGNVFVTGSSIGGGFFRDYATIKYSGAGVPLWTNRYNGPTNDSYASAVAVDASGNVFVTGYSWGSGSGNDYATINYSGAGVPLWTNRYNGPGKGDDYASAVAVDGSGNVFVTGFSTGTSGNYDYATIKYSSAGVPLLSITRTTTNTVAVSWPSPATGFTLQQNTNPATTNWTDVPATPTLDPTNLHYQVTVSPTNGRSFYRLKQQ